MDVDFFSEYTPTHWLLWPSLSIVAGECACCEETKGLMISLGWLCFSVGVVFMPKGH